MKKLSILLEEARSGLLLEEDRVQVVQRIKAQAISNQEDEDLYTLIHIIGYAGMTQDISLESSKGELGLKSLVEEFLHYSEDVDIASIALKVLCDYWGYAEDYLSVIEEFIHGVSWDEDKELFRISVGIAGEFIRDFHPRKQKVLNLLIDSWEHCRNKDISGINAEACYEALARATGKDWNALLSDPRPDQSVIDKAYKMSQS